MSVTNRVRSSSEQSAETPPAIDPVLELATALARPTLDEAAREAVERLAPVVDPEDLLTTAHHLGVAPLVAAHLADEETGAPMNHRARAVERCRATGTRNLVFAAELHRVLTAFADADLRCLAYKGPVLAVSAYGDLSRRDFSDLDMFVPPEQVAEACAVLESLGYERVSADDAPAPDDRHLVARAVECAYHRAADGITVELRWRLGTAVSASWLDFDEAWARRTEVAVAGRPVPTFSAEDTLLVLARHGAKHSWNRLGWVVDVAAFIDAIDVEWDRLDARAADAGLRRVLDTCLLLAAETADAPVPAKRLADARADPVVRGVVADARAFVAANPETAAYGKHARRRQTAYELRLCDSRRDRLRTLARLAFVPRAADYATVSLPDSVAGCYRLVRPARLVAAAIRNRLPRR